MKKKYTIALLMVMALVCIFALASCDGNGENPNKFNPTQMEKLGDAFRKLESKNYAVDSTLYYVEKDGSLTKRSFAVYRFAGDDFSFFYDGSTDKASHIIDEFYEFNEDMGWYYRYSYKAEPYPQVLRCPPLCRIRNKLRRYPAPRPYRRQGATSARRKYPSAPRRLIGGY